MTREEAIKIIDAGKDFFSDKEYIEALDMAIEALEQEPKTNFERKAEIVISQLRADRDRLQDALDKIRKEIKEHADRLEDSLYGDGMRHCIDIIDKYKVESEE